MSAPPPRPDRSPNPSPRSVRLVGWGFVAIQGAFLAALVLLPGRDDWPTPAWLRILGMVLIVGGLAGIGVASLRLGSALTATPVPTERGSLTTGGLYRYVRHPIYTAVLGIVIGLVIRSGSVPSLAVGLATVGFFNVKARWEERRLAVAYPDYAAYAARTPRFIPHPRPSRP